MKKHINKLENQNLQDEVDLLVGFKNQLASRAITSIEDIVDYYNDLVQIRDELVDHYFNSMPTPTVSYENPRPLDTRDDEYATDSEKEEPRSEGRESSDSVLGLFTRGIYKLQAGGGFRHTTFTIEMGRNDVADCITDKHIVTTTREGEELHIYLLGELRTKTSHGAISYIVNSFKEIQQKIDSKLLHEIEELKLMMKYRDHSLQQKRLERQIQKSISGLLLSATENKITTYVNSIATEDDFVDGQQTIEQIIPLLHAEDPKFFYNIFLGFDLRTGKFQTDAKKNKNFQKYFNSKKSAIRLQDFEATPPALTSGNLFPAKLNTFLEPLKGNVASIQTEREKMAEMVSHQHGCFHKTPQEISEIVDQIYTLREREGATTQDEKDEVTRKLLLEIEEEYRMRYSEIEFQDSQFNAATELLIRAAIWNCFPELQDRQHNQYRKEFDTERGLFTGLLKNHFTTLQGELGEKHFGERFVKPKISIRDLLDSDGVYLDAMRRRIRSDYFDYRSNKACTMDLEEFVSAIDRYIPEMEVVLETHKKVAQNHFNNRLKEKSIKRIDSLEKEIQESGNSTFRRTTETISELLRALIEREFRVQWFARYVDKDGQETKTEILEYHINGFVTALQEYHNFRYGESLDVQSIFAGAQKYIDQQFKFENRLKILKNFEVDIHLATPQLQEGLQKEFDNLQYNTGMFGIRSINSCEKIKKLAQEAKILLKLPNRPPLEEYYLHRLRTPESVAQKYSKELRFDRDMGSMGYQKGDLASLPELEALLIDMGVPTTRNEILQLDIRKERSIDADKFFDIDQLVPIKVGFPKVTVTCYGNLNEKNQVEGHYLLVYNPQKKLFELLFDGTVMDGSILQQRHNIFDKHILGGGYMTFYKDKKIVEIRDLNKEFHHEPRIITIGAIFNALQKTDGPREVFLGGDGYTRRENYF